MLSKDELRQRTILNLKELMYMLENDNIGTTYSRFVDWNREVTSKSEFDRLRIQTTQDLLNISKKIE